MRKQPYRHEVKSHYRDGKLVKGYVRGTGTRQQKLPRINVPKISPNFYERQQPTQEYYPPQEQPEAPQIPVEEEPEYEHELVLGQDGLNLNQIQVNEDEINTPQTGQRNSLAEYDFSITTKEDANLGMYMDTINMSYGELVSIMGEPEPMNDYKSKVQWTIKDSDMNVLAIYDNRQKKNPEDVTTWTISGRGLDVKKALKRFKEMVGAPVSQNQLNKLSEV